MKVLFPTEYTCSSKTLAAMCGAEVTGACEVRVKGLCTDSREAGEGICFVALRGERVDGHDFIPSALSLGSACVLCRQIPEGEILADVAFLTVPDPEKALLDLASARREELTLPITAVTGSVGKTTTKELIASVLSVGRNTYRSLGNHNSLIGMPLSLLAIGADAEEAVLEMGMSALGEIEAMSHAARPDIAVITNIGSSHMELLGSRENILRAKSEIRSGLVPGGLLLLNGDEPLLRQLDGKSYRTAFVSIEGKNADYLAQNIRMDTEYTRFDLIAHGVVHRELCIRALGAHNVYAALFAFAVGEARGCSLEEIREGLLAYSPSGMRQTVCKIGDLTLLEDCYNAAPESMRAALRVLVDYAALTKTRSVAVLGSMLELGEASADLHRAVGAYAAELGVSLLCVFGQGGREIAKGAEEAGLPTDRIHIFSEEKGSREAAEQMFGELLTAGDTVLVKASRGVGLEALTDTWKLHGV